MPQKYELFLDKNKKVKLAANDQGEFFLEANGNVVKINDEGLKLGKRDQGGENALAAVGLSEAEVAAIAQENGYSTEDRITEVDLNNFFSDLRYQDLTYSSVNNKTMISKGTSYYDIELNDFVDTPGFYRGVLEIFIAGKNSSATPGYNKKSALNRFYFTYINDGKDSPNYYTSIRNQSDNNIGEGPIAYKAFKKYVTDNNAIPNPTYGDFKDNSLETTLSNTNQVNNIWASASTVPSGSYDQPEYIYGAQAFDPVQYYFPTSNPKTYEVQVRLGVVMTHNDKIQISHSLWGDSVAYTNFYYDNENEMPLYYPSFAYGQINPTYGIYNSTYPEIRGKIILERVTDALGFGFDDLTAQP